MNESPERSDLSVDQHLFVGDAECRHVQVILVRQETLPGKAVVEWWQCQFCAVRFVPEARKDG